MELFWKAAGGAVIAAILGISIQKKDLSLILTLSVSIMIAVLLLQYLEPVIDLIQELQTIGELQGELLGILLKALGIGLTTEICSMACSDAGSASIGKSIQLLGSVVVLWLSLPIFNTLLELICQILGDV